jgi:hypothetical protein
MIPVEYLEEFKTEINYADVEYISEHGHWPNNQTPLWAIELAEERKCDPNHWSIFMYAAHYEVLNLRDKIVDLEHQLKQKNNENTPS